MGNSINKKTISEYDGELDLQIVREDLAAELLAINQDVQHIESITDSKTIKILGKLPSLKKNTLPGYLI